MSTRRLTLGSSSSMPGLSVSSCIRSPSNRRATRLKLRSVGCVNGSPVDGFRSSSRSIGQLSVRDNSSRSLAEHSTRVRRRRCGHQRASA